MVARLSDARAWIGPGAYRAGGKNIRGLGAALRTQSMGINGRRACTRSPRRWERAPTGRRPLESAPWKPAIRRHWPCRSAMDSRWPRSRTSRRIRPSQRGRTGPWCAPMVNQALSGDGQSTLTRPMVPPTVVSASVFDPVVSAQWTYVSSTAPPPPDTMSSRIHVIRGLGSRPARSSRCGGDGIG